ncbi:hypothetical protein A6V27_13335 [Hafnia alvei]|uniref:hypothetical protein n=1 Tax=Hafnia alvei TaxID=569 RepID=UPI0007BC9D82|nr:hypothetical protein [Hafnia alvei]ANC41273.1 hypothetical protein A6V27_13335 [Hafnia alvei]
MFDFPQPNEQYRSSQNMLVRVIGVLHHGIPFELPYRCPNVDWDPFKKSYTIIIRIEYNGKIVEYPLGRFLSAFKCVSPDTNKRDPINRLATLNEITQSPDLNRYRAKNLSYYPVGNSLQSRYKPTAIKPTRLSWWQGDNMAPEKESHDYRQFL